jgi:hypothetical protein
MLDGPVGRTSGEQMIIERAKRVVEFSGGERVGQCVEYVGCVFSCVAEFIECVLKQAPVEGRLKRSSDREMIGRLVYAHVPVGAGDPGPELDRGQVALTDRAQAEHDACFAWRKATLIGV